MAVTAAIVQARLGSKRLPGKVLMPLGGMSVLARCLGRVREVRGVDVVCVATVADAGGERIAAEARAAGAEVYFGPEDDVLARTLGAAEYCGAAVALRITSDCPFVDPILAGEVLALRAEEGADLAANNAPAHFPYGVDAEAFTVVWLRRADREAREGAAREHVTPFIRNHPEARRFSLVEPTPDDFAIGLRWAVDYEEDLAFARAAQDLLDASGTDHRYETLTRLLRARPDIVALNALRRDSNRAVSCPAGFRTVVRKSPSTGQTRSRRSPACD